MTLFFIIVGVIVAGLVLLAALALCKAARMGDEAQDAYIRRHEDAKDWEERL